MRRTSNETVLYLHDELPASGHPPFREQEVLRLLLLLGLLDLGQTADRVHALAIVWSRLGQSDQTQNGRFKLWHSLIML